MTRKGALPVLSLSYLFIFCVAIFERNAFASIEINEDTEIIEKKRIEGCIECGDYRCPGDFGKCLLGSVLDPCKCCATGICARLDGEPCWNSSIPGLPSKRRNDGLCARNYECKLRSDLRKEDEPEATCVCMEQTPACGNDNKTYTTPCALHEEAMRRKRSSSLTLQHLGPCQSRPWILSPLEDVLSVFGQRLALNCEAKGFPVPDIFWEFHAADGRKVLKLPGEAQGATVHSSVGPEPLMRTSWMQLPRVTKEYVGMYHCIAKNSWGEASSASFVSMSEH
ncbi:insulin-like growth factor-binding protein-related protein 1 [Bombus vosnesenskii]|uniref:Insulin-like growth factor-binding protein-related protein 1 n=3 Tax=Bombus TaxID=28641 RepID=A0A6J3KPB4_9HYME|nr:insulin-like growth factor-binding protein-related protein 1 [Bombus terrestris]XP_033318037.1 insulin-like growth factor-binding protein-related protein 1 [Bombus bifarius]XP_033353966.1 insulin-like growth factor-binding protein-related protein 1 [Bombus vosnesenskii]XP_043591993.1 insulin-like growth factor-binding protein-related protein 1 [Bombus pyrosoma]XP_060822556.1 insulin-like growth factor-binding protein-related protein 1 [Bombus pascuorum]